MDTFLIAHLEAAMSRSRVSPYAVARFLMVGSVPAMWLALAHNAAEGDVVAIALIFLNTIVAPIRYRMINKAERQNARGFLNSAKSEWVWRSVFLVWALVISGLTLAGACTPSDLGWLAFFWLSSTRDYFAALNWTSPPAKAVWDRGMAGGGV